MADFLESKSSNSELDSTSTADVQVLERLKASHEQILSQIRKVIIGQELVVEQVLISLFVGRAFHHYRGPWPRENSFNQNISQCARFGIQANTVYS